MVEDVADLPSPALLVYRGRVEANLRRMVTLAGGVHRLRPHIKTHKMPDLVRLQLDLGITRFKCATIAEAEMAAMCGVPDLLLAYPLVGPNARRFAELIAAFPRTRFSATGDAAEGLAALAEAVRGLQPPTVEGSPVPVLLDLDVGQHRTGVVANGQAVELYRWIASQPAFSPGGLHAYDGHIIESEPAARAAACEAAFAPVARLRDQLVALGLPVPRIVAGGTPTLAIHARMEGVECSPGTCVFWDACYAAKFPDLGFEPAALVLTRVVSKPAANCLCLDLGYKAVAAEVPHPRVHFLGLPDAQARLHSEEHLVVETEQAGRFRVGDCLYGLPWHICPTVALHAEAVVVQEGRVAGRWKVAARDRRLSI